MLDQLVYTSKTNQQFLMSSITCMFIIAIYMYWIPYKSLIKKNVEVKICVCVLPYCKTYDVNISCSLKTTLDPAIIQQYFTGPTI